MFYKITLKDKSTVYFPVKELNAKMYEGERSRIIPDASFRGRLANIKREYSSAVDWEMVEDEEVPQDL